MKLAYITTIAATQWSFLRGQNPCMAARGFELHAISSPGPHLRNLGERDGVRVHAVPIAREIRPWGDLITFFRLFRLLRRLKPDIVHVSTSKAALLGALAACLARIPVRIFLIRGLASESATGLKRWLYLRLERITARLCNSTISVAPSLLEYAKREGVLRNGEGVVLANGMSNGVDATRFDPKSTSNTDVLAEHPQLNERIVVGFAGRLARDKGIEELAQAWQSIRGEFSNTALLLLGDWEAECRVDPAVRRMLEQDPRVVMPGRVDEMPKYYKCMDVFVLPTHGGEGFPNVPVEAACMQLPVVATSVVGCVDAVRDGVTGALVEPGNPAALERAVRRYLEHPELRETHGRNGRSRAVSQFGREPIWAALYQHYVAELERYGLEVSLSEPESESSYESRSEQNETRSYEGKAG